MSPPRSIQPQSPWPGYRTGTQHSAAIFELPAAGVPPIKRGLVAARKLRSWFTDLPPSGAPVSASDDRFVDLIALDRYFQVWRYGVGHSELLLHARAGEADLEHLDVVFEDVRAVKLRSSYRPLILRAADDITREHVLTFAGIPARHRHRYLSLTLPSPPGEEGFIVCGRTTVLTVPKAQAPGSLGFWPTGTRTVHVFRNQDRIT
jgi:hypothetical protein